MADESKHQGKGTFTNTALSDLRQACTDRESEAASLLTAGFTAGALAQRVYALEIAVKVLVCEHLDLDLLPIACKTHDLSLLITFTGLHRALRSQEDAILSTNWEVLESFSKQRLNDMRYRPAIEMDEVEAALLLSALDDPEHGVLAWLRRFRSS